MTDLLKLAERCEAATGEYDPDLCSALHDVAQPGYVQPANYCASIDAAMTLVPEGWDYCLSKGCDEPANVGMSPAGKVAEVHGNAITPALALCAAALRARSEAAAVGGR